jgi:hypothetical protein
VKPEIRVEGADELRRHLRSLEGDVRNLKDAHKAAAEVVAKDAERQAPRRSGRLAGSIRAAGQARQGVVRAGFARIPYANVIHFGWAGHNIEPQPFLYDALDRRTSEVLDTYETQVNNLLRSNDLA